MYHKENVDYASLIWEDFQYQFDNQQSNIRRCDSMPYPSDSSKGDGITLEVLDEPTGKFAVSYKGDGISPEKDVSEINKVKQEHAAKEKMSKYSTTPFDQAANDEYVYKDILFKMMMASKSYKNHPTHMALRHEDKDQDPPGGSDQGKKNKRTRKDAELSMKSSKSKESAKGKTLSNTSKADKSLSVDKSVHKSEHVVPMDAKEPNLNNVANDADEP
nr:hypothetical protein [Tanacetum cinerariifolium]